MCQDAHTDSTGECLVQGPIQFLDWSYISLSREQQPFTGLQEYLQFQNTGSKLPREYFLFQGEDDSSLYTAKKKTKIIRLN